MKILWFLLLGLSAPLSACVHASHGVHGMVVLQVDHQLIASHLPLPFGKHAHQIVLQISAELPAEIRLALQQKNLVTLEPEAFALQDLQQGKLTSFNAKLYLGHFERGGQALGDIKVSVQRKLLDQAVGSVSARHQPYRIALPGGELLVNPIKGEGDVDEISYLAKGKAVEPLYFERADFAPQAK